MKTGDEQPRAIVIKRLQQVILMVACAVMLGGAQTQAAVLGGFYNFSGPSNSFDDLDGDDFDDGKLADLAEVTGVDVRIWGGDGTRSGMSSNDGTFGNSVIGTETMDSANPANAMPAENGAIVMRPGGGDPVMFLEVRNNTALDLLLDSIFLDYYIAENNSMSGNGDQVDQMRIFYQEGDLTDADGTVLDTVVFPDVPGFDFPSGLQAWNDYGIDLDVGGANASLSDLTLAPGQRAQFVIRGDSGGGPPLFTDNIALTGSLVDAVIPEPSTYITFAGLVLCFGAASWWRKQRQARK